MLGLRNLARSVPRSAARLSTKAIRPQSTLFRQAAAFHPSWTQAAPKLTSSFHMSALRRQEESSGLGEELVAKLQSEISMEEDASQDNDLTANINAYLDNSPFKIEDKPGHQEVVLTRTFGDEKIRVTFSTADLNNNVPGEEFEESAYEDVDLETQSGGANTKGAVSQGRTSDGNVRVAAEDGVADQEIEDDLEGEGQGFPAHVNVTIERPGKGALSIEAIAQDGDFLIEELYHFPSADLADPATADKEWQRRTLYSGPPFNNLDEDLQILLERYLEERGINTPLALFIPDYIDHKEQKEYVRWLNSIKTFVG